MVRKTIFFPPKHRRLARTITIKSPSAFRASIKKLSKGGITLVEKRALVLARNRAKAMLKRKNLSAKERRQMREISRIKLPPIMKRFGFKVEEIT